MKQLLFFSQNDFSGFILRVTLGCIMFPHGAQKFLGLFGGNGFTATMLFFRESMGLPWIISFLIIFVEFFGALGLLAGFATRVWALGLIAIMIGAIVTVSGQHGFFMNWFGNKGGEGFEYHLLVMGICFALLATGSGKYSVDSVILK